MWEFPIGEDLVLVRPEVQGLFLLNATAGASWDALGSHSSIEEASASIAASFDIPPSRAETDVQLLVQQWTSDHLVGPLPPTLKQSFLKLSSKREPEAIEHYSLQGKSFRI